MSIPFPPEIAIVSGEGSRPDGVMWSMEPKTVVWIELTRPWEDNCDNIHEPKITRYNKLAIGLREGKHIGRTRWRAIPLYVEVKCRGNRERGPGMVCTAGWASQRPSLGEPPKQRRRLLRGAAIIYSCADS